MISLSTVFVLGAGASVPYGFDTGRQLLERARLLSEDDIVKLIAPPYPRFGATPLHDALVHTGESSIDAMLESIPIRQPRLESRCGAVFRSAEGSRYYAWCAIAAQVRP